MYRTVTINGVPDNTNDHIAELKLIDNKTARYVDIANTGDYLKGRTQYRAIICKNTTTESLCITDDPRLENRVIEVKMIPSNLDVFDSIRIVKDGLRFVYAGTVHGSKILGSKLRIQLNMDVIPVTTPSGTPKNISDIYKSLRSNEIDRRRELIQETLTDRIKRSVHHMGGTYIGHTIRNTGYCVTYTIEYNNSSIEHMSIIDENLNIIKAGVCLDNEDRKYDLASIIDVLKEGHTKRKIHRVGL
jgi:hypothetical protein